MASKRHKKIGELLDSLSLTKHMQKREEVSVKDLVPSFPGRAMKIDWYVKELKLVIEVHGRQHYEPVAFGNRGDAKQQFAKQVQHDIDKQNALLGAGYLYLEVPYWEKLNEAWLLEAITELIPESGEQSTDSEDQPPAAPVVSKPKPRISSRGWPKRSIQASHRPLRSRGFQKRPEKKSEPTWRDELAQLQKDLNDQDE